MTTPEERLRALDAWAGAPYHHADPEGLIDRVLESRRRRRSHRRRVRVLAPLGAGVAGLAAAITLLMTATTPVTTSALDLHGAVWAVPSPGALPRDNAGQPLTDVVTSGEDLGLLGLDATATSLNETALVMHGYGPDQSISKAWTSARFVAGPRLSDATSTARVLELLGPSALRAWSLRLAAALGVRATSVIPERGGAFVVKGPVGVVDVTPISRARDSAVLWTYERTAPVCRGEVRDHAGRLVGCASASAPGHPTTWKALEASDRLLAALPMHGLRPEGAAEPTGVSAAFDDGTIKGAAEFAFSFGDDALVTAVGLGTRAVSKGTFRVVSARTAVGRLGRPATTTHARPRVVELVAATLTYAPVRLTGGTTLLVPVYVLSDASGDEFLVPALEQT